MLKREFIPVGKENAISRRDLCRITGLSDRQVRREIAQLRLQDFDDDMVIVSTYRGRGYYLTDNVDEIMGCIADMTARIRSIVQTIDHDRAVVDRIRKKRMYGAGLADIRAPKYIYGEV